MPKIIYNLFGLICLLGLVNTQGVPCNVSNHFTCRNNASICIPVTAVRDGKADCPDNSDEEPCLAEEFECSNAQCIPLAFFQDGHEDCDDGSDEECTDDQYTCLCGFPRCIPQSRVKDGTFDCVEGSDEIPVDEDTFSCSFLDDSGNEVYNRKKRQVSSGTDINTTQSEKSTGLLSSTVETVVHDGLTSVMTTEMYGENAPDGQYFKFLSTAVTTIQPSILSSIEWGEQMDLDTKDIKIESEIEKLAEFKKQATIFSNFYSSEQQELLKSSLLATEQILQTFPAPDWTPRETVSANVLISGKLLPSRIPFNSKLMNKKSDSIKTQKLSKGNDFIYPAYVITYTIGEDNLKKSKKMDASKVVKEIVTTEVSSSETSSTVQDVTEQLLEPVTESSLQDSVIESGFKKIRPKIQLSVIEKIRESHKIEVRKKPLSLLHTHTVGIGQTNIFPTARSRFFRPSPAIIRGNVQQTSRTVSSSNIDTIRKNVVKHSKITLKGFVDFTTTISGTEIIFVPQSTNNAETTFKIEPSKSLFENSISEMNEVIDVVRDSKQDFGLNKITTSTADILIPTETTTLSESEIITDSKVSEQTNAVTIGSEVKSSEETTSETIGSEITSSFLSSSELVSEITGQLITNEVTPTIEPEQTITMQTVELKQSTILEESIVTTLSEASDDTSMSDLFETIDFHNKPNTNLNPFSGMVDIADMDMHLLPPEDEFPLGIISSTEGITEADGTTTLFTTVIIGTFIEGNYAQVIQSTSSLVHTVTIDEDATSHTEFTTYTHYSTIMKDNFPSVISSLDIVSNVVTENVKSEIQPTTTTVVSDDAALTIVDFNTVSEPFLTATSAVHVENVDTAQEIAQQNETSLLSTLGGEFQTIFTTFTYFTTLTRGNFPFITSSMEIISQVLPSVVDNLEKETSMPPFSETHLTTLTAITTESQTDFPSVISNQEIITNIIQDSNINTHEESIQTETISTSPIMKTLLFTSYSTILRDDFSTVTSNIVTSTLPEVEVVNNESVTTIPLTYQTIIRSNPSKIEESVDLQIKNTTNLIDQMTANVKTMFTTLTQFITSYNGDFPSVTSSTVVITNLITEPIAPSISQQESSQNENLTPTKSPEVLMTDMDLMMTKFVTYTYFTTFFLQTGTTVATRLVTTSEVVPISDSMSPATSTLATNEINPSNSLTEAVNTSDNVTPEVTIPDQSSMMTRFVTLTYFTTFFLQDGTSVATREETKSEVVPISDSASSSTPTLSMTDIPLIEATTSTDSFQTVTYTFFTTYFQDGHSFISSSEQLMTVAISDPRNQTINETVTLEPTKPNDVMTVTNNVTYLTTLFLDNSTSALSNIVIETSLVTLDSSQSANSENPKSQLTSSILSETMTATNTYYTTFFLDGSTSVISREETSTEVVLKTVPILVTPSQVAKIEADEVAHEVAHAHHIESEQSSPLPELYNTFTQFTTFFLNGSSSVTSSIIVVPKESVLIGGSNTVESTISPLHPTGRSIKDSILIDSISSSNPSLAQTESQSIVAVLNPLSESSSTFSEFQAIQSNADLNIDLLNQSETVKESKFVRNISQLVLNNLTFADNSTLTHLPIMANEVTNDKTISKYLLLPSSHSIGDPQLPSSVLRTLYTTFTYSTTLYSGEHTITSTRLETVSSVYTDFIQPSVTTSSKEELKSVYTTYTFFTTFIKDGVTSITSSESTQTNLVTDLSSIQSISSSKVSESYPMTKYTTFTYYTTFYDGNSSTTQSREEIKSTVYYSSEAKTSSTDLSNVGFSTVKTVTPEQLSSVKVNPEPSSVSVVPTATTYYTTFTYYTTSYKDDQSFITSRLETISKVVTDTTGVTFTPSSITPSATEINNTPTPIANNPLTSTTEPTSTTTSASLPTGLLSTINSTNVKEGLTTAYVTEIHGTYIGGMYAHIQQTSSSIFVGPDVAIITSPLSTSSSSALVVTPTSLVNLYPTGLVTETSGSIVNGGTVTLFTSRVIGTYIEGTYAQIVESTSRIVLGAETASNVQEKTKSTTDDIYKTGLVSTIAGSSEVNSGITTLHETQVLGTYIEGSYAQILQPTIRILTSSVPSSILTSNFVQSTQTTSKSVLFTTPISTTSAVINSSPVEELNDSSTSALKPTSSRFRPRPFTRSRQNNFFTRKSSSSSSTSTSAATVSVTTTSRSKPFNRGPSSAKSSGVKSSSGTFRGSSPGFRSSSSYSYRPTSSRNGGRGSSYPGSRSSYSGSRASSYPGRSSGRSSSSRASGTSKTGPTTRGKFTYRPRNSRFSKSSSVVASSSPYATSSVYPKSSSRSSSSSSVAADNSLIEPSFDATPAVSSEDIDENNNENEEVVEETASSSSRAIADKQISKSTSTNKQIEDENEDTPDENGDKRKVLFRPFRPGQRRPFFPRNRLKNRKNKADSQDQTESGSELHEIETEPGKIFVHEYAVEQVSRKRRSPRKNDNSEESGEDFGMKKLYRRRYQRPNRSTISPAKRHPPSKSQSNVKSQSTAAKTQTQAKTQAPTKSQSATPRKITIRARSSKVSSKTKENVPINPTRTTKNNLRTQTQRRRANTQTTTAKVVTTTETPTQTTKVRPSKTRSRSRSAKRNSREKFTIRPTATRRSRPTTRSRSDYPRRVVATRRRIGDSRQTRRTKGIVSDSWGSGSVKRNKQVVRTALMPALITVTHTVNTSKVLTIFHGRETEIRTLPTTSLSEQTLRTNDYSTVNELGKTKFVLESSMVTDILNPTVAHITEVIITSTVKPTATISRLRGGGRETKTSTVTLYGVTTVVSESTQLVPLQGTNQLASLLLPQLLLNQFFPNQQLSLTTSYYTHVTTTTVHSSSIIPLVFRGKTKYSTLSERKVYPTTIITSTTLPVTVAPNFPQINPLFPLFNPLQQYQLLQPQFQQQQQQQMAPPTAIESFIQPSIEAESPEFYEPEFELESEEDIEVAPPPPPPPPSKKQRSQKPERTTPITSVLTLYLSGEKPGQFNSFITTVTLNADGDDEQTGRVRRAADISKPTDILEMTAFPELYDLIGDDESYHQDIRNNANVILVSASTDIDEYGLRKSDLETDSLDNYKEDLVKSTQDSESQENVEDVEEEDAESEEVVDEEEDEEPEVEQIATTMVNVTINNRTKRDVEGEDDEDEDKEDDEDEDESEAIEEDSKLRTYTRYFTRIKDGSHRISSTIETVTRNTLKSIKPGFTRSLVRGSRVSHARLIETDESDDIDEESTANIKPSTTIKRIRQKVSRVRRPVSRKLVRLRPKVTTDSEQQLSTKDSAEVPISNPQLNRLPTKPPITLDVENDEEEKEESEEDDYEDDPTTTDEPTIKQTVKMSDIENSFTSEKITPSTSLLEESDQIETKSSRSRVKLIRVRPSASSSAFGSKRIVSSRRIKLPVRGTSSNKHAKTVNTLESETEDESPVIKSTSSTFKASNTRTRLFPTHPVALTYYTTFTYYSTLVSDGVTQMRSREAVTSQVTTEPLNTRVASIIQTSAGYSVQPEDARLTNFGTRTRQGVTTIVNAGSRVRVSDGGILPTLPPSDHVIRVKPTDRPIPTAINGRRHGAGPGDAPRTYLTIYTYYYTFIDDVQTKYSSSEATHRELARGSTKPLPENFERTEDSFGLYTLNTDSPLTNLGFRVLGGTTTSVNLGDKTIVMFGNVPLSATSTKLLTDDPTVLTDFSTDSSPSRVFATRSRLLKPKGSRYKVIRTRVRPSSQATTESSFNLETNEEPIFESSVKLPGEDDKKFQSTFPIESSIESLIVTEVSHDAISSETPELPSVQSVQSTSVLPSSSFSSSKFRYQSTRGSSRGGSSGYQPSSSSSGYSRKSFGSRKPFTRPKSSTTKSLPSNVLYVTYTTTSFLSYLGGTRGKTLHVITSSLRTLGPAELALLTTSQLQSSIFDNSSIEADTNSTDTDSPILTTPISDTSIQSTLQSSLSSHQSSIFPSSVSSLSSQISSGHFSSSSMHPSFFSSSKFSSSLSSSSNIHPFLSSSSSKSSLSLYSTLSRLSSSSIQSSITEFETTHTVLETLTSTHTYTLTSLDGSSQVLSVKEDTTTEVVTKTLTETVTSTLFLSSTSVVPHPVDVTSKPPLNISDIISNNDVHNLSTTTTTSGSSAIPQQKTELVTKVMPDNVTLLVAASPSDLISDSTTTTLDLLQTQASASTIDSTLTTNSPVISASTTDESSLSTQASTSSIPQETVHTTYTYFTTFFDGGGTRIVSRTEVSSSLRSGNTQTATIAPEQTSSMEVSEVAHSPGITETLYTTYTYLHLFKTENTIHTVTSMSTTFNTMVHASDSNVPTRLILQETKTSSSTNTFYSTTYEGSNEVVTSAEEVVTQIIITRAPFMGKLPITPTPTTATTTIVEAPSNANIITKTYLTTFTYFTSFLENSNVITSSNTEVITNIVTQFLTPLITDSARTTSPISIPNQVLTSLSQSLTPSLSQSVTPSLSQSLTPSVSQSLTYNVKTFFTTSTYFTTYFDGTGSSIVSREVTESNVVSEMVKPSLPSNNLITTTTTAVPSPTSNLNLVEIQPTSPFETLSTKAPDVIRVRTYFTTFTSFTTLIDGTNTVVNSKIDIKSSIETIFPTRVNIQPSSSSSVPTPASIVSGSTIIFFNDVKSSNENQLKLSASSSKPDPIPVFTPSPASSVLTTSTLSLTTSVPIPTNSKPQPVSGNNAASVGSGGSSFLSGVAPILGGLAAAFLSSGGMNGISNRNDTDKNIQQHINSPQIPPGAIVPAAHDPIFIPLQQPPQHHNAIPLVLPLPNEVNQMDNALPAAPIYQGSFKPGVTEKGFTPILSSSSEIEDKSFVRRPSVSTVTSVFQGQSTLFFNRPQSDYKPSIATFTFHGSGSEDEYVTAAGKFHESVINGKTMVLALHPENTNDRAGFHTISPSIDHMIGAGAETKDQSVLALASINDFELPSKVTTIYKTYTYFTTLNDKGVTRVISSEETVSQVSTIYESVELLTSSLVLHIEPQSTISTTTREIKPTIVLGQRDSSEIPNPVHKININRNDVLPGTPEQLVPRPGPIAVQVPPGSFIPLSPGHSFQIPVQNEQFINVPGAVTQQIAGIEFAPHRGSLETRMVTYTHYSTIFSNGRRITSTHEQIMPSVFTIAPTTTVRTQQVNTNTLFISIANGETGILGVHPEVQLGLRTTTSTFVPAKTVDFPFNIQISSVQQNVQDTNTVITNKIDIDHSLVQKEPTLIQGSLRTITRLRTFTHYTSFIQNGQKTASSREEIITEFVTEGHSPIRQSTAFGAPVEILEIDHGSDRSDTGLRNSLILGVASSFATNRETISVEPIRSITKDEIDHITVSIQPSPTVVTPSHVHTVDQSSLLHVLQSLHNVIDDNQKKSELLLPVNFTLDSSISSKIINPTEKFSIKHVTFTHYTTFFQDGSRVISTRTEVVPATLSVTDRIDDTIITTSDAATRSTVITFSPTTQTTTTAIGPDTIITNAVTSFIASRPVIHVGNFPVSDTVNRTVITETSSTSTTSTIKPDITTFTSAKFTPTIRTLGTVVSSSVQMEPVTTSFQTGFSFIDGSIPPEIRTYYTTYTYYTSYIKDRSIPIVSTRRETITRVSTVPISTIRDTTSVINIQPQINTTSVTSFAVQPTTTTDVLTKTIYKTRTIYFTTFLQPGRSSIYSSPEVYGVIIPPKPTRIIWYQDGELNVDRTILDPNQFQSKIHVTGQILSSGIFGSRTVLYVVNTDIQGLVKTTTVDNTLLHTTLINGQQTLFIQQTAEPSFVSPTSSNEVIWTASTKINQGIIKPSSVEVKTSVQIGATSVKVVEHGGGTVGSVEDTLTTRTPELGDSINLLGIHTKPTVLIGGVQPIDKDGTKTTSIASGSTIVSGAETIFSEVFTRPVGTSTNIIYSNDERLVTDKGIVTRYITYVDSTKRTIAQTTPTTIGTRSTNIVNVNTYPRRTMVITVLGDKTVINYVNAQHQPLDATDMLKIFGTKVATLPEPTTTRQPDDASVLVQAGFGNGFGGGRKPETTTTTQRAKVESKENEIDGHSERIKANGNEDQCKPMCNVLQGEVCREVGPSSYKCVCRTGFFRPSFSNTCRGVRSYLVKVPLVSMARNPLHYSTVYANKNSNEFNQVSSKSKKGVDEILNLSDAVGRYYYNGKVKTLSNGQSVGARQGVLANIVIQVNNNSAVDEAMLQKEIIQYLTKNDYTLGTTDLKTSPSANAITVEDFDECSDNDFNDCSSNGICKNTPGSYTCSCNDQYLDDDSRFPGRICLEAASPCDFCSFHGVCAQGEDGHRYCKCDKWYLGKNCQVNGYALAIILPIIIGLLLIAILLWLCCCCRKGRCCVAGSCCTCCEPRPRASAAARGASAGVFPILNSGVAGTGGTLDKKAMIAGDTSSESSGEQSRLAHVADVFGGGGTHKSGKSASSYEDRSISALVTEPPVLIPRAKHQHPKQYISASTENIITREDTTDFMGAENKLMSILDGEARHERNMAIQKESSSFATLPTAMSSKAKVTSGRHEAKKSATHDRGLRGESRVASSSTNIDSSSGYTKFSSSASAGKAERSANASSSQLRSTNRAAASANAAAASATLSQDISSHAAKKKHGGKSGESGGAATMHVISTSNYLNSNDLMHEAESAFSHGDTSSRPATYSSNRDATDFDNFSSRFETASTGQFGNTTTMSMARSFDETTIHPERRGIGSYYSSSTKDRSMRFFREEPYQTDMDEAITDMSTMMMSNNQMLYEHDSDASGSSNPSAILPKVHRRGGNTDRKYESSYYSYESKTTNNYNHT